MRSSIPGPSFAAFLVGLVLLSSPLKAELVVFTHGGFLEVKSYRIEGEKIHLVLARGGNLEMSIYLVESILTNEIRDPEPEPEPPPLDFNFRFAEGQGVPQTPYGELIFAAAKRHRLNPELVAAVVRAESAFDPRAVSSKGARGLMQLMPASAREYGLVGEDVFDPEKNLDAGTRHLEKLTRRLDGDLALVLAAYNAGYETVQRYNGIPPFRETHDYVRRVYAELGLSTDAGASTPPPAASEAGTGGR